MRVFKSLPCYEQAGGKDKNGNSGHRLDTSQTMLYHSCDILDKMESKQNTNLDALRFSFKLRGIVVEFLSS